MRSHRVTTEQQRVMQLGRVWYCKGRTSNDGLGQGMYSGCGPKQSVLPANTGRKAGPIGAGVPLLTCSAAPCGLCCAHANPTITSQHEMTSPAHRRCRLPDDIVLLQVLLFEAPGCRMQIGGLCERWRPLKQPSVALRARGNPGTLFLRVSEAPGSGSCRAAPLQLSRGKQVLCMGRLPHRILGEAGIARQTRRAEGGASIAAARQLRLPLLLARVSHMLVLAHLPHGAPYAHPPNSSTLMLFQAW